MTDDRDPRLLSERMRDPNLHMDQHWFVDEVAALEDRIKRLTSENDANMELARRLSTRPDASNVTLEMLRDQVVAGIPDSTESLIKIRATVCHFVHVVEDQIKAIRVERPLTVDGIQDLVDKLKTERSLRVEAERARDKARQDVRNLAATIEYYAASDIQRLTAERDQIQARLASARVCDQCEGDGREVVKRDAQGGIVQFADHPCPHCTNGVRFDGVSARVCDCHRFVQAAGTYYAPKPDCPHCHGKGVRFDGEGGLDLAVYLRNEIEERQDLAERLRKAEEALDVIPIDLMVAGGPPYRVTFSEGAMAALKAAKEQAGKERA